MFDDLSVDNFFLFCAKHYNNPHCKGVDDFNDDLDHIKYVKRLFNRFEKTGDLRENLIINHFVLLYNVFDSEAMTKILFYKIPESQWYIQWGSGRNRDTNTLQKLCIRANRKNKSH